MKLKANLDKAMSLTALCLAMVPSLHAAEAARSTPFTLESALGTPDWLDLTFENATRYESLDNQFRSGYTGSDQILLSRSLLGLGFNVADNFKVVTEFIDSRQSLADDGTRITTSLVDTLDVLQAYVSFKAGDAFAGGDLTVNFGRQTVDMGSRRMIARQAYRLTINSFDGIDVQWKNKAGMSVRVFYFRPVQIKPTDTAELLDNEQEMNESSEGTKFYGAFSSFAGMPLGGTLELYSFFLEEKDSEDYATADSRLCTPGFRFFRKAAKSTYDYEVEAVYQFGESRSSTKATDTTDLDHSAWMTHLAAGYTFDAAWKPRLSLEYDYASGDDDPDDDENNHYNTLYGVARGDLGPTSLWSAFSRTNINSPSVRVTAKPYKGIDFMLCDRFVWLASKTDSWAGVRDKTGASGDYVGNQIEGRVRWDAIPGNLKFEGGLAYLFAGEFMKDAPNSPDNGNAVYSYFMATIKM